VIDKEELLNPKLLGDFIYRNGITILLLTSALFNRIAEFSVDVFKGSGTYLLEGCIISNSY